MRLFTSLLAFASSLPSRSSSGGMREDDNQIAMKSVAAPMVVVFGRPGAGKTTVAERALELFTDANKENETSARVPSVDVVGLDLDICVPQWMRDNFAAGIYPTLAERQIFATEACDHVQQSIEERLHEAESEVVHTVASIVSFSFVNDDLRDTYRKRFPQSKWVLVDTSAAEAQRRTEEREGHFYKGKVEASTEKVVAAEVPVEEDNSEWDFAPVSFPHISLSGTDTIEVNAQRVVEILKASLSEF